MEQYAEAGIAPPLVEVDAGQYLIDAMFALGPSRPLGGGGLRATDWPEIAGYAAAQGPFARWELQALADMCAHWCRGYRHGASALAVSPLERAQAT